MKTFISNPVRRVTYLLLASLWLLLGGAVSGSAQQPAQNANLQQAPAFKVGAISIRFVGTANVNEQIVRANMQIREGSDFDEVTLDRDIRSLYRTGLFEFIEVKHEIAGDRTYNLVVEVTPKFPPKLAF